TRSLPWQRFGLPAAWAAMVGVRLALHPAAAHASLRALAANAALVPAALGQIVAPVAPAAMAVLEDLPAWRGLAAAAAIAVAAVRGARVRRGVVLAGAAAFLALLAPSMLVEGTLVLGQRFYLPAVGVLVVLAELARAAAPERRTVVAFAAIGV